VSFSVRVIVAFVPSGAVATIRRRTLTDLCNRLVVRRSEWRPPSGEPVLVVLGSGPDEPEGREQDHHADDRADHEYSFQSGDVVQVYP
jgi:hypothetical protein